MPPSANVRLDVEAVSGILGSISIACWVVVFTPQIVENFRRSSAAGLSLTFVVIWLLGDVFNILGAVMQGVLPTMIVLAIYYTLADIVLLIQCLYYRMYCNSNAKSSKHAKPRRAGEEDVETAPLLDGQETTAQSDTPNTPRLHRRHTGDQVDSYGGVDGSHLSPAVPLHDPPRSSNTDSPAVNNLKPRSTFQTVLFNTVALLLVCVAGAFGWWLSTYSQGSHHEYHKPSHSHHHEPHNKQPSELNFDLWGQIFGYLCAVLYLGSRVPQLLLNHKRKSTEGLNALFFLFACVGNLTYVLSILAYAPPCSKVRKTFEPMGSGPTGIALLKSYQHGSIDILACEDGEWKDEYLNYLLINLSWLIGSAGTLFLDLGIFAQFWMYQGMQPTEETNEES